MSRADRLYITIYDIASPKRWRAVFRTMHGYGEWVQLSAFQCRLSQVRHAEMLADLDRLINHDQDHVVIMDLGAADAANLRVTSLGKRPFAALQLDPVIV